MLKVTSRKVLLHWYPAATYRVVSGYAYLHRLVHGVACGIGYRPAGVVVVAVAGCVIKAASTQF